ncbi:peptidylprolyl isomerase [Paracoccus cavernae]
MSKVRKKGKSLVVWVLMAMLMFGLVGFGVDSFTSSGTEIGQVGKVAITDGDYARGLRNEMQGFAQQTGRNLTNEEAKSIGLPQVVLSRQVQVASLEDKANRLGVSVGDDVVAKQLQDAPAFKNLSGQFDPAVYADVLRREGLTVREFEHDLRMDEARMILQRAVVSGVKAPAAFTDLSTSWLLETRDLRWQELVAADLSAPVAVPDEATLEAWHQANADRFTAPEKRKISYAWLTPDMIEGSVQLDDQALRDLYQQRIDEFQKPERRMVERLVFQNAADAEAAKARLDRGEVTFEALVNERGLTLNDIDLGEVTKDELGTAGEAVFAIDQPAVVGPIAVDLGSALFSMNAILEPQDISFEQAKADLRGEAALDRARRQIDDLRGQVDDLLAGGATLDELASETEMQLGSIEWSETDQPEHGSIAAYPDFRSYAQALKVDDFLELHDLDDGGIFVLQLTETVPPALIPFAEVRDRVADDWVASETKRQLQALGAERRLAVMAETLTPPEEAAPAAPAVDVATGAEVTEAPAAVSQGEWHEVAALARDGFIEGTPAALVAAAFALNEVGDAEVVADGNRVFLVSLDAVHPADLGAEEAAQVKTGVERRLSDALQQDMYEYFSRALLAEQSVTINQAAVDAVNSRM